MTQSTEKELYEQWREDYALKCEPNYCEGTDHDCRAAFLAGMKAARRAQVAPKGWKLVPVVADEKMQRAIAAQFNGTAREAADAWSEAIAAAPQPPEAAPAFACNVGGHPPVTPEMKRMGAHIAKKMAEESPPPEPTPTQPR